MTEPVVTPTFTIYQEYPGRIPLAHVDAYRLEGLDEEEVALTGIDDALTRDKAAFIEWPDYIRDRLPADAIWLAIRRGPEPNLAPDLRELEFSYLEKETWLDEALSH